jgi:hypothetical protein
MDRRNESRFQVYAPAKVFPLNDPEGETVGQIIDISGLGLRLIANAEFHQDQIIIIETDQHLILANVRNCEVRGTRFGIGAERIHSVAKLSLPRPPSTPQSNQALVEDYRRRLLNDELAELELSQAKPAQLQAERPEAKLVVEPQARNAASETPPALKIVSPVQAVDNTGDLPEAPFLPELPSPQDRPASPLKTYAPEPISGVVQLPASPTQGPPPWTASLVLDVSLANSLVEVPPLAIQATGLSVPQRYPPVVVSTWTTLMFAWNTAELIPLQMGNSCPGVGPVPPPENDAVETPLRQPRLPFLQAERGPAWETALFASPPLAAAWCPSWEGHHSWEGHQGTGRAFPPLAATLRPHADVARRIPRARHESLGALSSFPLFAATPDIPVPPKELLVVSAAHLPPTITPRHTPRTAKAPSTCRAFALAKAPSQLAVGFTTPLRCEASSGEVNTMRLLITIASQLPRAARILPSASVGLSPAEGAVPLGCSIARNLPPTVETTDAVTSALPFLLLSAPLSIATPAMPLWSTTRSLWPEACRLPASVIEQHFALSAAFLRPSRSSPLSLVTWSQSLSISIPACNPSNLCRYAPIGVSSNQGGAHGLRPSSPSRRGYRLTPLLPKPNGVAWSPVAPVLASLRPPTVKARRPGRAGTAPPCLAAVRVQPASMSVLPPALAPFGIESVTGLVASGKSLEDTLKFACIDGAHGILRTAWDLRAESSIVLPSFSAGGHPVGIRLAPCSRRVWRGAIPPVQTVSKVQPFSALKRLAGSMTACLPGAGATGLMQRQDLTPSLTSSAEAHGSEGELARGRIKVCPRLVPS